MGHPVKDSNIHITLLRLWLLRWINIFQNVYRQTNAFSILSFIVFFYNHEWAFWKLIKIDPDILFASSSLQTTS